MTSGKSEALFRASRAHHEGRLANRHQRWARDAMDAFGASDERARGGRRSRSVLIPRRWYQVGRGVFRIVGGDGGNKARSPGRLRRKPLKPLRRECRNRFGDLWWTYSYAFFICMRGCGCGEASGIPCSLCFRGTTSGKARARFAARTRWHEPSGERAAVFQNKWFPWPEPDGLLHVVKKVDRDLRSVRS